MYSLEPMDVVSLLRYSYMLVPLIMDTKRRVLAAEILRTTSRRLRASIFAIGIALLAIERRT
jgi:hypothetical protein